MSIVGTWMVQYKAPVGKVKSTWIISEEDSGYKCNIEIMGKSADAEYFNFEDNNFETKGTMSVPLGELEMVMRAAYDEASDTFKGVAESKMGNLPFQGKRQ